MKLQRPPYILAYAGDTAGCGFHRIFRPIELMGRAGVAYGMGQVQFVPDQELKALRPDIVVFQRQNEVHQVEAMKRYRDILPGVFTVFEIDDALSAVPEKSWHHPYMPPKIDERTAIAAAECDAITVTTHELANHMRKICEPYKQVDVRVVPNMLGRDDMANVQAVKMKLPRRSNQKFRIGWGGGVGHPGDLAILDECFKALGADVKWCFIGMKPDTPPGVDAEFVGAFPPHMYLQALASMDADLIVAPLEDHYFNRCKSNLRLVESGAIGCPVIASPVVPYLENSAPVVGYAKEAADWAPMIREFMALDPAKRAWQGERMRRWVEQNYILDDHADKRLEGWLPKHTHAFLPKPVAVPTMKPIAVSENEYEGFSQSKSLADAVKLASNADIFYVRKGTCVTADQLTRIQKALRPDMASVSVLSNDSGAVAFPKANQFTPIDIPFSKEIDGICAEHLDIIDLPFACGPVMVLRRSALSMIGSPDIERSVNDDAAIVEWSALAGLRGFKNNVFTGVYAQVPQVLGFDQGTAMEIASRLTNRYRPKFTGTEKIEEIREAIEIKLHKKMYHFITPQNQSDYAQWLQLVGTLGPRELEQASDWAAEKKLDIAFVEYDPYATGFLSYDADHTWTVFAQKGAITEAHVIPAFIEAIEKDPKASVFYADHDYIAPDGTRQGHDFKPNFDLHLFLGRDYVTPIMCVRTEYLQELAVDPEEMHAAALYGLVLQRVAFGGRQEIGHIPHILSTLQLPDMVKLSKLTTQKIKNANDFLATEYKYPKVDPHEIGMGLMKMSYMSPEKPPVAIVLLTKNKTDMLMPCLATVLRMTTYPNFKVLIVDNGSDNPDMLEFLKGIKDERVEVVRYEDDFNWSKINNWAVRYLGDAYPYICFLNDDTRIIATEWLDHMVGAAMIPDVGAVGAKLYYPAGFIQHIGISCDRAVNAHPMKGLPAQLPGYQGICAVSHEATAATGACLVVRKTVFDELGGFDEDFVRNFNDVIFGVRLREKGYYTVIANRAELQHLEGVTRNANDPSQGRDWIVKESRLLIEKIGDVVDPYWNPNLRLYALGDSVHVVGHMMDQLTWRRHKWPWSLDQRAENILLVGPPETAEGERQDGNSIYYLAVTGFVAKISSPPMENVRAFDTRKPERATQVLKMLGIDRILFTGLGETPITLLSFLLRLGLHVTYRPTDAEMICPRGSTQTGEGKSCERGWERNECKVCVERNNTRQGYVNVFAWKAQWAEFVCHPLVQMDFTDLSDDLKSAVSDFFTKGKAA